MAANEKKPEPGSFEEQNRNANAGIHEVGSFGDQNQKANFPQPIVPDADPVARALTQMRAAAQHTSPDAPALTAPNKEAEHTRRITQLEDLITGIISSLNAATITAVCNGDGTITITLTLPSLPG